ncbi:MAG: molybdenum cofactor guanylyltransferase [Vicinamibacterales bacterium]
MDDAPTFGAIVLAGGRSTRLGRDKASELLLDRPLLQHVLDRIGGLVDELIIVRAPGQTLPEIEASLELHVADDAYPGSGPLGGICTGLQAARAERCLAVACDMPLLSRPLLSELLRRSAECDVVMPVVEYPEPLHAVYARSCVDAMRERLEAGQLKITGFLGAVHVCYMREAECRSFDPDLRSFVNTNTEEDLVRARALLAEESGG